MAEIIDSESLEEWLRGRPPEDAVLIAARVVMRSLPLIEIALTVNQLRFRANILLPTLRATAVATFAGTWPKLAFAAFAPNDTRPSFARNASTASRAALAASRKYYATAASVSSAAGHAANAADNATRAFFAAGADAESSAAFTNAVFHDVANTTKAAYAAAAAAYAAAAYAALNEDAVLLAIGAVHDIVAARPLWSGSSGTSETPESVRDAWDRLRKHLTEDAPIEEGWLVWINWYEARLHGMPPNADLDRAIALIDDKIWEAGPEVANAEVARLVELHSISGGGGDESGDEGLAKTSKLSPVDFEYDADIHQMRPVPHGDEAAPAQASSPTGLDRNEYLSILEQGCNALASGILEHDVNVPEFFREDLIAYARECAKRDEAFGGWLKFLGAAFIRSQADPAIRGGLGDYLGPRLDDIVSYHQELMLYWLPGARPQPADVDAHELPEETDLAGVPDQIAAALDDAAEERGRDGPPPLEPSAVEKLQTETNALAETTQRLALTSDPDLRAVLAREQRRAIVTIGAALSHYYLRVAEWSDRPGPKLAMRVGFSGGALAFLARALGFI